jgi:trehalose 6-phosphate phosphatase
MMSEPIAMGGVSTPRIAVFTDFDGTLVEIADTPDGVSVAPDLHDRLTRTIAACDRAFAVLTGRQIADIDRYLSPLRLPVAGVHGAERRRADGTLAEPDPAIAAAARDIAMTVTPLARSHNGLALEAKPGAVALHYRLAPALAEACRFAMEQAVNAHPGFTLVAGKMVYEARPAATDKGTALRAYMAEKPFSGRIPVFVGDDVTDEDGFRAAQELGGVGIKIGEGDTIARMRVADVAAAHTLLSALGRIAATATTAAPARAASAG